MQPANGQDDQAIGEEVGVNRNAAKGDGPLKQGDGGDKGANIDGEGSGSSKEKQTEIAVTAITRPTIPSGQQQEAESSPGTRSLNSKKRQRDETTGEPSARDERLGVGSSHVGELSSHREPPTGEGQEAGLGKRVESVAAGSGQKAFEKGRNFYRDAFKPFVDPKVKEVVSQDLATQEIRRVRRKESDPSRPPLVPSSHQSAAADRGESKRGGADPACKEKRAALPNGETPPPLRKQANGEERARVTAEASGGVGAEWTASKSSTVGGAVVSPKRDSSAGEGSREREGEEEERRKLSPRADKKPNGVVPSKKQPADSPLSGLQVPSAPAAAPPSAAPPAESIPVRPQGERSESVGTRPRPFSPCGQAGQARPAPPEREVGTGSGGVGVAESAGRRGENSDSKAEPMEEDEDDGQRERVTNKGVSKECENKGEGTGSKGPRCPEHALPVARSFFDYNSVSHFEMRMLPEFFTGRSASKTAEMYMQSRNYIVRSYQRMLETDRNGQAFLTGTECRRKLAGDACSTLRIHDFLDRFGLINTQTGGKRPPSFPVLPPSVHLWSPTPASERPSRATKSTILGAGTRGRVQEPDRSVASTGLAGVQGIGARGFDSAQAQQQQQQQERGVSESGGREWHRKELVKLMEAAVATPDQWETVAFQVGGGRTPTACMRQFLNLAVEDVLKEEEREERPAIVQGTASPRASVSKTDDLPDGGSKESAADFAPKVGAGASGDKLPTPDALPRGEYRPPQSGKVGLKPAPSAGSASGIFGSGKFRGDRGKGGTESNVTDAGKGSCRNVSGRGERQARLGQAAPALVLASALVSSVHPEVLRAATSAAAAAADDVARRSGASPTSRTAASTGSYDDYLVMREAATKETDGERAQARRGADSAANGQKDRGSSEAHTSAPWARDEGSGPLAEVDRRASRAAAARAAVLSVVGLQARGLAEQEDRRTEVLIADLLEARLQRLETKLHCLDGLDQVLEIERQSLEHDRAEFQAEQARSMLSK